jgi:hypothetical protein
MGSGEDARPDCASRAARRYPRAMTDIFPSQVDQLAAARALTET